MENFILDVIKISLLQFIYAVGVIIACGLILGYMEKQSNDFLQKTFGWNGIILTGVIGTTIHELGHLFMCYIFNHDVKRVKLLRVKESKRDGVLGYVEHTYNPKSLYQTIGNFFIGVGPVVLGSISIFLSMRLLMSNMYNNVYKYLLAQYSHIKGFDESFFQAFKNIFVKIWKELFSYNNFSTLNFWIFIFIAVSIASHMALSKADIKGSISGIVSLYVISLVLSIGFNLINMNMNYIYSKIFMFNAFISMILFVSLSFSLITLIVNFCIYILKKKML